MNDVYRGPGPLLGTRLSLDDVALATVDMWNRPDRDDVFKLLRDEAPVRFFPEPVVEPYPEGPGFWAVTRYDDVQHVSRHPELFCSGRGGSNVGDIPQELAEFLGSIINMDDPRHAKLRRLVSFGFTPRELEKLLDQVRVRARDVIDAVAPKGECDFVQEIAAPLPLQIIADMMGVDPVLEPRIIELTNHILGVGDPEYVQSFDDLVQAFVELSGIGLEMGTERLANPRDDITSTLMHAEVDGERLTTQEFASFFVLLVVAGNETTRTAISHGMLALHRHPDQRRLWTSDPARYTKPAVEEIVRWATPVIHFRRTATADTEIAGVKIREGEKVVMWFNSANRDERRFDEPFRFDITRDPNVHLGFGGGGPHFCLGANLARREIAVMFDEIFRRLPDLEVTGPPDMLQSWFIHGIKRMPCAFSPTG